jgi:hypothetical protein
MIPEEQRRQAELRDLENKRSQLSQLDRELRDAKDWRDFALDKYKSDFPNSWQKGSGYKNVEKFHNERVGEIEQKIQERKQYLQQTYGITPGNKEELDQAIAKKEEQLRSIDPQQQRKEPAIPGYGMAERRAAKLAAQAEAQQQAAPEPAPPVAPPSQDTPTRQPSGETKPTAQQQSQHEQEFHRQMDQYYESQPPSQPTPAPHQPGHLKDLQPTKTDEQEQPPTEDKPTSHQHEKIPLIDRYKDDTPEEEEHPSEHEPTDTHEDTHADWQALKQLAAQVKEMEQDIGKLNDDMTLEQQEKSGPWKTPLRELYDLGPEPPSPQGPERDRDR